MLKKRDEMCSLLHNTCSDVFALTETRLNPDIADSELLPDHVDFFIYRYDRPDRRGGGELLSVERSIVLFLLDLHIKSSYLEMG